jgi:hypothetical protein
MHGSESKVDALSFVMDRTGACGSVPAMWHFTRLLFVFTMLALSAVACTSIVGDACTLDADCGTGLICDASQPEGYCTRSSCLEQGCSEEAICVAFDADTSYCVRPCSEASDCRPGYACVNDFALYPFCAASP